ncbi:hypothetical protein EG68_09492 [Paragonimus skrjabini miyazakii]|uniref:Golgi SNAP receptor complex member 2 n=1 Tax=Paragonimus skrjabini miyazakii TaxID=59628 RepID=A0A8S9YPI3_9TREM|nr:hypothetical protein EG68_09492 [Paragonimus skrjabini miyazakii]
MRVPNAIMQYDELSRQTKILLHTLPTDLAQVERRITGMCSLEQIPDVTKTIRDISIKLQTISSNCDRLSSLLTTSEPVSQRSKMRLSLDQMRYECKHYQASLELAERKQRHRERELREREDLLAHDFTTNAALRDGGNSEVIRLDADLEHHSRLSTVGRRLDEMLASGSASLVALKEQGMTLKSAHRRVLDLLNTLGLSNTVMRLIERRTHQDKVLFWLLAGVSLFLMWLIWRYLH